MASSTRFSNAILKLYNAFYNNRLNPEDCKQCAVGNILDNNDSWKHFTDSHGSVKLSYVGLVHQQLGRRFYGYTPLELLEIEASFLNGCGYKGLNKGYCHKPENYKNKDVIFNGLCKVIETLCKLDGSTNIMDYSTLFKHADTIQKVEAVV